MRGDPKPRRMSRSGVPTRVSSTVSPMCTRNDRITQHVRGRLPDRELVLVGPPAPFVFEFGDRRVDTGSAARPRRRRPDRRHVARTARSVQSSSPKSHTRCPPPKESGSARRAAKADVTEGRPKRRTPQLTSRGCASRPVRLCLQRTRPIGADPLQTQGRRTSSATRPNWRRSGLGDDLGGGGVVEDQAAVRRSVDEDRVAVGVVLALAAATAMGSATLALQHTLQRAGTEVGVVADLRHPRTRRPA